MIYFLFLILFTLNISSAQKAKERVKYFNSLRFQSDDKIKENIYSFQDSLVKFESLGPYKTNITTFEKQGLGRINDVMLFNDDVNKILVGSAAGGLWLSNNQGENWHYLKTGYGSFGVSKLYNIDGVVYILTGDSELSHISNAYSKGIIYSDINLNLFNKIDIPSEDNLLLTSLVKFNDILYLTSNQGLYQIIDNKATKIYEKKDDVFRSIVIFKDKIYFSFLNKDSSGIIEFNPDNKEYNILFQDETSRIELENPFSDSDNLYALVAEKNLREFRFVKTNDLIKWDTIKIDKNLLEGQLDYNLDFEIAPFSKNTILLGGVPIYYTVNNFQDVSKIPSIHVDIHSIKFHPLTNDIFICSDGGLHKFSSDLKNIDYLSIGQSISQFFDFDVSPIKNDIISAGAMDNGTLLFKDNKWDYIGAGDGMKTFFLNDSTLLTSYQRGSIFRHNLKSNTSQLISSEIIENHSTPFYTNYLYENDSLFYLSNKLLIYDIENENSSTFSSNNEIIISALKKDNIIFYSTTKQLFALDLLSEKIMIEQDINQIFSEMKFYNDTLFLASSSYEYPGLYFYDFTQNKIFSYTDILKDIPINSFEFHKEYIYLGTDNGLLKYSKNDSNIIDLKNSGIDLGVISNIKIKEEFDYLYLSTFSNGMFRLKLNDCDLENILINVKDTISICRGDSIKLEILNYNESINYTINNQVIMQIYYVKKEGDYFVTAQKSNCLEFSELFYVKFKNQKEINIISPSGTEVCEGDSIQLIINNQEIKNEEVNWSNGAIGKSIWVSTGNYYAIISNDEECNIYTDTLKITSKPLPYKAKINHSFDKIQADTIVDWYFEGNLVKENSREIDINNFGYYYAITKNKNCINISDSIEISANNKIKVYPNPVDDYIHIQTLFENNIKIQLKISDFRGKIVYSDSYDNKNKPNYFKIDLSYYNKGVYMLLVIYDGNLYTEKLLKY